MLGVWIGDGLAMMQMTKVRLRRGSAESKKKNSLWVRVSGFERVTPLKPPRIAVFLLFNGWSTV
jgi:hypothetical protein